MLLDFHFFFSPGYFFFSISFSILLSLWKYIFSFYLVRRRGQFSCVQKCDVIKKSLDYREKYLNKRSHQSIKNFLIEDINSYAKYISKFLIMQMKYIRLMGGLWLPLKMRDIHYNIKQFTRTWVVQFQIKML